MALLGRSKRFGAVGRALRVPRGQRSVHTHCSSVVQGAGGKATYFFKLRCGTRMQDPTGTLSLLREADGGGGGAGRRVSTPANTLL